MVLDFKVGFKVSDDIESLFFARLGYRQSR